MEVLKCKICHKVFSRLDNLKRHISSTHANISYEKKMVYKCSNCSMQSTYKANVTRHLKRVHGIEEECKEQINNEAVNKEKSEKYLTKEKSFLRVCETCNVEIATEKFSSHLKSLSHKQNSCAEIEPGVYLINSAFKRNIATYRIKYDSQNEGAITDVPLFFSKIKDRVLKLIGMALRENSLKINFELFACYVNSTKENDDETCIKNEVKSFNSKYEIVTTSTSLDEIYSHFFNALKTKSEEFEVSKFIILKYRIIYIILFFILG